MNMKWFISVAFLLPTVGFCVLWFFAERRRSEERYWFDKRREELRKRIMETTNEA